MQNGKIYAKSLLTLNPMVATVEGIRSSTSANYMFSIKSGTESDRRTDRSTFRKCSHSGASASKAATTMICRDLKLDKNLHF